MRLQSVLALSIPALVPLGVAALKRISDDIPKLFIPLVTPVLGAVAAWLITISLGDGISAFHGALLGAVGVFVREVVDQYRQGNYR